MPEGGEGYLLAQSVWDQDNLQVSFERIGLKDIARRKGTETGTATAEEIAALEKVTGFSYASLWDPKNAGLKH